MNFNFNALLSNGMKILNIVNKTLPLIKDINPSIINIKKTINKLTKNNNIQKKELLTTNINNPIIKNNNSLTFFK